MSVSIEGVPAVSRMLAEMNGIYPKVTYRAINKSVAKTKTAVNSAIREQINLPAAYVREKLKTQSATPSELSGRVYGEKRGILLSRFSANALLQKSKSLPSRLKGRAGLSDGSVSFDAIPAGKKLKQISVKIKTHGSRQKLKLFPIRLRGSNAIGLAVRTGKGKRDYKILYGPSISQVFNTLKDGLEGDASREFLAQFESQLDYELSRIRQS